MILAFEEGNDRFNYRVAGVAVHEDSVLLHRAEGDDFWTLPGGRAEFGEPAERTLKREMREEIGIDVEVVRLLWLVENFFEYGQERYHEVALYFLIRFRAAGSHPVRAGSFESPENVTKLTFQWFPCRTEVLSGLPLLPSFLQTGLEELPEGVQHVVHHDSTAV